MELSHQADFLAEKPCLQIIIEAASHKCYFLPKFHCELNPIEMHWVWVKICEYLVHSSLFELLILILGLCALNDGTFLTAKRLFPKFLDSCPKNVIQTFYQKLWHYMDAYRYILILFYFYLTYCIMFIT